MKSRYRVVYELVVAPSCYPECRFSEETVRSPLFLEEWQAEEFAKMIKGDDAARNVRVQQIDADDHVQLSDVVYV